MTGAQIRKAFLDFFNSKGHEIVQSSSLIPENDPTLLFSNAGMNQFKDLFLGTEKRSYTRACSSQKCLRISGKHNDLENVGVTARHHTFFEMLGNFSFGDYFKAEAIQYAWEFITQVLKLPKERLWVTIFEEDDEAKELWIKHTDISAERILKMGAKDNFWSMGETGPCGPCTEIHYYLGDDIDNQSEVEFRKDDGTYVEFWNLVFMQFDRSADGQMTPLPNPCVDTGMGLERVAAIKQDFKANYDCDLLRDLISVAEELSGFKYDGSSYEERDLKKDKAYARDVAMRVIADHARASAFLVADGITPGSDGRGYVLRRLIRRAVRHGRALEFDQPFLFKVAKAVIATMGEQFPELVQRKDVILKLIEAEERKFHETLDAGLSVLEQERAKLKSGELFPGKTAFLLHDTYGFPLDLTQDALKAHAIQVDTKGFDKAMQEQRERSREDRKGKGITFTSVKIDAAKTEFLGYQETEASSKLLQVIPGEDGEVALLFKETPFYAESGGQVGDTGVIRFNGALLEVLDTQKVHQDYFAHTCKIVEGDFSEKLKGQTAELFVDTERREKIKRNHSATHIVHAALREVLGDHVKQAGSRVDDRTLRFDFSHFEPVTDAQMLAIQDFANEQIRMNHEVVTRVMAIDEAKNTGAVALFGEKYGESVRVIEIGPKSLEFCGGTHTTRSGDIGYILTLQETGVSAGVRRIECVAGLGAHQEIMSHVDELAALASLLKSDTTNLPEKFEKLLERNKELEKELAGLQSKLATSKSQDLVSHARKSPSGISVVVEKVDGVDAKGLRVMVDDLRNRLGSGVVALGSTVGDSTLLVAGVTSDLTKSLNAGNLVKEAVKISGGRGGGKSDFAQAGGGDPTKLTDALERLFQLVA